MTFCQSKRDSTNSIIFTKLPYNIHIMIPLKPPLSCYPTLLVLLVSVLAGCTASSATRPSPTDSAVMAFGAQVGAQVRTIQAAALFIQEELAKPQPNLHEMQAAHARIKTAYLDLSEMSRTPEALLDLHDQWITASFDCEYLTNLAIINGGGDLTPCLSEIDVVVKATEQYMPAQEETPKTTP
jgi:hypothetical protein